MLVQNFRNPQAHMHTHTTRQKDIQVHKHVRMCNLCKKKQCLVERHSVQVLQGEKLAGSSSILHVYLCGPSLLT